MTTLKIALAQSPQRAAWTEAHGIIEVRALLTDRRNAHAPTTQQTWTHAMRYELLTNGVPQMVGSYREITEIASHIAHRGAPVDWQPVWERAPLTATQTTQAQEGR